jgi:hypothetical protein
MASMTAETSIVHQVTPLDNLVKLAVQYRTSIAAIRRLNPELLLANHIPPNIKEIRVPRSAAANSTTSTSKEEKEQGEANERYFKEKAFVQKFNCEEEEAIYYLNQTKYDLEAAIRILQKEIEAVKVGEFVKKVRGLCTVEEAEHWLKSSKWRVEMAVHYFNSYNKAMAKTKPNFGFEPSAPPSASFDESIHNDDATEMHSLLGRADNSDYENDWRKDYNDYWKGQKHKTE